MKNGGFVIFECGHRLNIDAEMKNGVKCITAPPTKCPECSRLVAAAPELLDELKAAHQIIFNALNIMNEDQKCEWSDRNERDGVKDGWAVTREEARRIAIAKAEDPQGPGIEPDEAA